MATFKSVKTKLNHFETQRNLTGNCLGDKCFILLAFLLFVTDHPRADQRLPQGAGDICWKIPPGRTWSCWRRPGERSDLPLSSAPPSVSLFSPHTHADTHTCMRAHMHTPHPHTHLPPHHHPTQTNKRLHAKCRQAASRWAVRKCRQLICWNSELKGDVVGKVEETFVCGRIILPHHLPPFPLKFSLCELEHVPSNEYHHICNDFLQAWN